MKNSLQGVYILNKDNSTMRVLQQRKSKKIKAKNKEKFVFYNQELP